jgi:DNA helicase II / ATP-dependent DNA helicase PcrA
VAKRKFALPGIHELSKEQEDARALPKRGRYLIIGGPGTGKSVVALFRSRRHHDDKDDYTFLVYNRLLHQASRHLFVSNLSSKTWNSWFDEMFKERTGRSTPLLPAPEGKKWQEIDWDNVLQIIGALDTIGESDKLPFLIIDEGQDMPPQFYQALVNLGFENFYVVADQNQQIIPGRNSSRQDIKNILDISLDDVIELKHNYRNSYPIARLAREFYTGDPASPAPELPPAQRTTNLPILVEYGGDCDETFDSLIGTILKTADRNSGKLLGIIAPSNNVRDRYVQALSSAKVKLDNEMPQIRTYKSGANAQLSFDEGGIMVINAQSCKGLEFEIVYLADIDQHYCDPWIYDEKKRLFYVMIARANSKHDGVQLFLLKESGKHCPIESILPNNPDILERRR